MTNEATAQRGAPTGDSIIAELRKQTALLTEIAEQLACIRDVELSNISEQIEVLRERRTT